VGKDSGERKKIDAPASEYVIPLRLQSIGSSRNTVLPPAGRPLGVRFLPHPRRGYEPAKYSHSFGYSFRSSGSRPDPSSRSSWFNAQVRKAYGSPVITVLRKDSLESSCKSSESGATHSHVTGPQDIPQYSLQEQAFCTCDSNLPQALTRDSNCTQLRKLVPLFGQGPNTRIALRAVPSHPRQSGAPRVGAGPAQKCLKAGAV
jgi:hypothetical protein